MMELIEVTYKIPNKKTSADLRERNWKVGITIEVGWCCREIRLGSHACEIGKIVQGLNSVTTQQEKWECVGFNQYTKRPLMKRLS